ncbi:hypothetical protein [Dickeya oryzae]
MSLQIVRLDALPDALAVLVAESQQQGFRFFIPVADGVSVWH